MTKRKSGIEILRIVAMLMIIGHHYVFHGASGRFVTSNAIEQYWLQILLIGGNIGVTVYMVISGYFLIDNNSFNIKRILKIWGQVFFYSIVIFIISSLFKLNGSFSILDLVKSIFPIISSAWWYATCYLIIYILSPFINKFLKSLSYNEYKLFLIIIFIIWFMIPTFLILQPVNEKLGLFFCVYCLGGFIKLYPNISKRIKRPLLVCVLLYLFIILSDFVISYLSLKYKALTEYTTHFANLNSIFVVAVSSLLFIVFNKIECQNKYINIIASTTFGVYLLHDSFLLRDLLWNNLFNNAKLINSISIILVSLLSIAQFLTKVPNQRKFLF